MYHSTVHIPTAHGTVILSGWPLTDNKRIPAEDDHVPEIRSAKGTYRIWKLEIDRNLYYVSITYISNLNINKEFGPLRS